MPQSFEEERKGKSLGKEMENLWIWKNIFPFIKDFFLQNKIQNVSKKIHSIH